MKNADDTAIISAAPNTTEDLTEDERRRVAELTEGVNLSDTNAIIQFGVPAQQNISEFSEAALNSVRSKDMGEVGNALANLVGELKGLDIDDAQKKSLFRNAAAKMTALKNRYSKVETNVTAITEKLEEHSLILQKDVATLDIMYGKNLEYFKELSLYVIAGKERLKAAKEAELPALENKAAQSGLPEDAQAVNDFANQINRFEKKLHDLELTRTISVQMAPQIRMIQNNETALIEKIQTSLINTIPLWRSQMVLALGLANAEQALHAQRSVTDYTNELLRKNAETLKTATIGVAAESERGIVDLETLKFTNERLISTLDEVRQIQAEGSEKRREAASELRRVENELKAKLLEFGK
ncbi:MAG: toxic anion resistance protein [Oscillospiraceae bacterium]|jgi:uncharacterized protein YaaN involved in tellurite resistance|nr:toxic anion resistance protein [Oscillospiraceae bacterium]MDR2360319.1 toxic anion resistance protein [Oscillospiraceae bacterium]